MRKSKLVFIAFIWLSIFCISSAHALSVKISEKELQTDMKNGISIKSYLADEKHAVIEMDFVSSTSYVDFGPGFSVKSSDIKKKGDLIELNMKFETSGTTFNPSKRISIEIQSEESLVLQQISINLDLSGTSYGGFFYDYIRFVPSEDIGVRFEMGTPAPSSQFSFSFSSKRLEVRSADIVVSPGGDISLPIHVKDKLYLKNNFYKILYMKNEGGMDWGMQELRWKEIQKNAPPQNDECKAFENGTLPLQVYYSQYMAALTVYPYNQNNQKFPFKLSLEYYLDEKCEGSPLVSEMFFFIPRD